MHGHKRTISDSIMVLKNCQGVSIARRQAVAEQFKVAHFVSRVEDGLKLILIAIRLVENMAKGLVHAELKSTTLIPQGNQI